MDAKNTQTTPPAANDYWRLIEDGQAVARYSPDGKILMFNPVYLDLLGYTADELEGRPHSEGVDETMAGSREYRQMWDRLKRGEKQAAQLLRRKREGEPLWMQSNFYAIAGAGGRVAEILEFAVDITREKLESAESQSKVNAISRSQGMVEFDLDGNILSANPNFLKVVGYEWDEVAGRHHRMFCEKDYAAGEEYREFWALLRRGEFHSGEFKRLGKNGQEIWLQATYNPSYDSAGRLTKVVKFASDVTREKLLTAESSGKIEALGRVQAIIEFDLEGKILDANENFLKTVGYTLEELRGKHHKMLCEESFVRSADYRYFWERLAAGEFERGEFKRIGKGGKEVWISASYNPIFDMNGKPFKVVKFATNITGNRRKMEAIGKSQAVIEFHVDGTILSANENFLQLFGYHLDDVRNRHHRILCDEAYAASAEYREFWTRLGRGEFHTGRFQRCGKGGKAIWLQATYNPIFDDEGRVVGVTKLASDISRQMEIENSVKRLAEDFNRKSKEIAAKSGSVARGAQNLGATAEEMTASIEELTASIHSISQNVKNSNGLAQGAQHDAQAGAQQIGQAIEAMAAISKSAEDISEIVKVMGEIASQTNLLAFNAAIEAARAGEHGWGFSVVADEVRKLAERSSQAARDITKLIQESLRRISLGGETSKSAGEAFAKIVAGVEKTTRSIAEIASSAEEQLIAAREVSAAIQNVARETEKAAEASEGIADSTRELTQGAETLQELVAHAGRKI